MTASELFTVVFGRAPAGIACHARPAAYAKVLNAAGHVAAVQANVRGRPEYWLPGGGTRPGEAPVETVAREVREELGRTVRPVRPIGRAIQFCYAGDEQRWYEMTATFFLAEFGVEPTVAGEYELHWLDLKQHAGRFFHACHAWTASQA